MFSGFSSSVESPPVMGDFRFYRLSI